MGDEDCDLSAVAVQRMSNLGCREHKSVVRLGDDHARPSGHNPAGFLGDDLGLRPAGRAALDLADHIARKSPAAIRLMKESSEFVRVMCLWACL